MKNYRKLFDACLTELKRINMDISDDIVRVSVNGRLSRALGRCKARYSPITGNYSMYEIEINPCMLGDDVEDKVTKNTIIHELIHTCPGCMNHGHEWKRRADRVNRMLGYNVQRVTESEKLESAGVELKRREFKYALVCEKCGAEIKRKRWSSALENPSAYRHSGCGGSLHTINLDGSHEILSASNKIR